MTDRHKNPPVAFRPDPANREWLQAQKECGRVINALINRALTRLRKQEEGEQS